MSHELRTPLNSLLILARMLAENTGSNLTGKQIEYAQTIHAAGADLLSLINDILDLAKIESGTITLNIAPERLADIGDYVKRAFGQVASDKQLDFKVEIDPGLPQTIQTDTKRLQQILKNLLANAFKFTDQGGVDLRIHRAKSGWKSGHDQLDDAPGVIAFTVTDTGIGIPDMKQKIIFEAFQQADGTTSRKYGGTGLGLSISRELTRLLGGDLRVASEPGKGSSFTLYLPFAHAFTDVSVDAVQRLRLQQDAARGAMHPIADTEKLERDVPVFATPQPCPELAGRKVLIIDDDPRNIFALTGALQDRGLTVLNAESGKRGLEILRSEPGVELVLMDIMMPELDGYDMIRILRGQDDHLRNLPIIAVTAKAMKGDREKCLAAGATDYVAKPVNVGDLVSLMRNWMVN
jgi:two-component system chemotaxis sensor kinase CheA